MEPKPLTAHSNTQNPPQPPLQQEAKIQRPSLTTRVHRQAGPPVTKAIIHKRGWPAGPHQTIQLARCPASPNMSYSFRALSSAAPTLAIAPPESVHAGPPHDVLSL